MPNISAMPQATGDRQTRPRAAGADSSGASSPPGDGLVMHLRHRRVVAPFDPQHADPRQRRGRREQ